MKYLIVSDLHVPDRAGEVPKEILQEAKKADGLICAGDLTTKEVYDKLKAANKNLTAVRGNCDSMSLPDFISFEKNGRKIGVLHSHHLGRGNITALVELAKTRGLDIIIFGHTHKPLIEEKENILLINPGSANGVSPMQGASLGKTYILLRLNGKPCAELRRMD